MEVFFCSYTVQSDNSKLFHCQLIGGKIWEGIVPGQKRMFSCEFRKAFNYEEAALRAAIFFGIDIPELHQNYTDTNRQDNTDSATQTQAG